jgi:Protein of unknown function (DUF2917)
MQTTQHMLSAARSASAAVCAASPAAFALPAGQALTLQPATAAVLRITQGTAWVTLPSLPGDHFLRAGDALRVPVGDKLVMEAWPHSAADPLRFAWDAAPAALPANLPVTLPVNMAAPLSYCSAVLVPLADLRAALALSAGAAARLLLGLGALGVGVLLDAATFLATSRARSSTV